MTSIRKHKRPTRNEIGRFLLSGKDEGPVVNFWWNYDITKGIAWTITYTDWLLRGHVLSVGRFGLVFFWGIKEKKEDVHGS